MPCTVDQETYSAPLPWIGLYITAASVACSIGMLADSIRGIVHRNVWFPCKVFALNATSLMLLTIATKLPVDLSTPMPDASSQFTKLTGTALICIAMGHFMPSIGAMEDSQVILNVVPLAILVVTVIVNVCIQMATGVIHDFIPEHLITLCFMLIFLLFTCSSALTIPTMKRLLKQQCELKCRKVPHDQGLPRNEPVTSTSARLRRDVQKYLMMALTSNPQHVLGRSYLGTASGILCMCEAIVLMEAFCQVTVSNSIYTCYRGTNSDYGWSVPFIFFSQTIAVLVGAIAPCYRMLVVDLMVSLSRYNDGDPSTVGSQDSNGGRGARCGLKVEKYWIQNFMEWKDRPLLFGIRSRFLQRFIHGSKNLCLEFIKVFHTSVVVFSKSLGGLNSYLVHPRDGGIQSKAFRVVHRCVLKQIEKLWTVVFRLSSTESLTEESVDSTVTRRELKSFVLRLEGEDELVDKMMHYCDANTERWIQRGRHNSLANLTNLLERVSTVSSQSFMGDQAPFNSNGVGESDPKCWALPLVTLTSIALATPSSQGARIKHLLRNGVSQGLKHIKCVDKNLDLQGGLANVREAADIIWVGVDLYHRWLDVDISALASEETEPGNVIRLLEEKGRSYALEFECMERGMENTEGGLKWPPKALAGYAMHRICKTILRDYSNLISSDDADCRVFEWLHVLISDMLGACLTNLPRALYMQCYNSCVEAKEDGVREAACLLGEAENILPALLLQSNNQEVVLDQCKYMDHWRSFMPSWATLPPISHVNGSDAVV